MSETQQVGRLNERATLWSGTTASRVDLHPLSNPVLSGALAVAGNQQVGYTYPTVAARHAALWSGSAATFVDLNPAGAPSSDARATDGEFQGGWAQLPNFTTHAALWHGTAASFVDLSPNPARESWINGMAPGQQVGWVEQPIAGGGGAEHAALWSGSAASFIDLHPYGPASSRISHLMATCGSAQVGDANIIGFGNVAGIWFGTAASFINLGQYLPPGYGESSATSVAFANGMYYVGGFAYPAGPGAAEAFLWVGIPAPGGLALLGVAAGVAAHRRRRTIP
jgi:hypothetical protein